MSIEEHLNWVFSTRQRSYGRVMFSQLSVCPQGVGYLWCQVPSWSLVPGPMSFWWVRYLWFHVPSGGGITCPLDTLSLGTLPLLRYTLPPEGTWDQRYPTPSPEPQKRYAPCKNAFLFLNFMFSLNLLDSVTKNNCHKKIRTCHLLC